MKIETQEFAEQLSDLLMSMAGVKDVMGTPQHVAAGVGYFEVILSSGRSVRVMVDEAPEGSVD